jgi:tRNA threonylcarbamoyladenosine biosynthesis protein TsaB
MPPNIIPYTCQNNFTLSAFETDIPDMITPPVILYIETATPICSVCIARGAEVLTIQHAATPNAHAKMLAVLIQQALTGSGTNAGQLHAICVSEGPGSYTGLRIGFATAKGMCYALNIPLIVVNTLQALAQQVKAATGNNPGTVYLPALDARRNDVYWSIYDPNLTQLLPVKCSNIDDVIPMLSGYDSIVAGGTGAFKFLGKQEINEIKTISIDASSIGLIPFSLVKFKNNAFADLAYCEPLYLKEFGEK